MDMLQIYGQDDLDPLPSGVWGIREPDPGWQGRRRTSSKLSKNFHETHLTCSLRVFDEDVSSLDLILVPVNKTRSEVH
jgi:hypothetical protein